MPETDEDDDKPLDPATERVRRKLTALILVSMGILGLAFLAVIWAIVVRVIDTGEPAFAASVDLPISAAELAGASADDESLILTIGGAEPRIEVRRRDDGALVQTFRLRR